MYFRYFTQVLAWIRDHKDFVHKWIQPVINKFGYHHIEASVRDYSFALSKNSELYFYFLGRINAWFGAISNRKTSI